jgi:hypothetical protein
VHQAIKHGVGHRGIGQQTVPLRDGNLGGDKGGAPAGSVVDHLEKVVLGLALKVSKPPVIKYQKIVACGLGNPGWVVHRVLPSITECAKQAANLDISSMEYH